MVERFLADRVNKIQELTGRGADLSSMEISGFSNPQGGTAPASNFDIGGMKL